LHFFETSNQQTVCYVISCVIKVGSRTDILRVITMVLLVHEVAYNSVFYCNRLFSFKFKFRVWYFFSCQGHEAGIVLNFEQIWTSRS